MRDTGSDPAQPSSTLGAEIETWLVNSYILRGPIRRAVKYVGVGHEAKGIEARLRVRRLLGPARLLRRFRLFARRPTRVGD